MIIIFGFLLATLVGVSLGLIGAGGSILTFPILVYVFKFNPIEATAYSLFIVGYTSLIGFYSYSKAKLIDYKVALIFGLPSIVTVYFVRRYLMPIIPNEIKIFDILISKSLFIISLFSILMLLASISLIKGNKDNLENKINYTFNYIINIFIYGFGVGLITGIVGAGGGFLIMPTLILLANLPVKKAVGTCLLILAFKSLIGFIGDAQIHKFNWYFIFNFCLFTTIGIIIGYILSKKISSNTIKSMFGYFEFAISIIIIIKEIILKIF